MREIKFRVWNGRKMIGWDFIKHVYECSFLNNAKIMQYTGLKDKNGKEIYEGDIVRGYFNADDVEDYLWLRLTDEEKKQEWKLFEVEDIHFGYKEPVPEILEVIGNIYENPELLKEDK